MTDGFRSYFLNSVVAKRKGGKVKRVCWSCGYKFDGWAKERCPKCKKKHVKVNNMKL